MKVLKAKNLRVIDISEEECIEIEGIKFSYHFFQSLDKDKIELNTNIGIIEKQ